MKEVKQITHYTHDGQKMYLGRTHYGKKPTIKWGLCLALFFLVMKWKYKEGALNDQNWTLPSHSKGFKPILEG